MPKYKVTKDGAKVFGPYKGSAQNGGRPTMVVKKGGKVYSVNKARYEYEKRNGKLPKDMHVDHKDNGGRAGRDHASNLRAISRSENIAKENKRRAKAKPSTTAKSKAKKAPRKARKAS